MEIIRDVLTNGSAKEARSIFINNKKTGEQVHLLNEEKVKDAILFLGGHALIPVRMTEVDLVENHISYFHVREFSNDIVVTFEFDKGGE